MVTLLLQSLRRCRRGGTRRCRWPRRCRKRLRLSGRVAVEGRFHCLVSEETDSLRTVVDGHVFRSGGCLLSRGISRDGGESVLPPPTAVVFHIRRKGPTCLQIPASYRQ